MTDLPASASFAEFSRLIRRDPAWVSRLASTDRLVLGTDGRVLVRESLARIEATSAHRDDVRERHEQARNAKDAPTTDDGELRKIRRQRAEADLRLRRAQADLAEQERMRKGGELVLWQAAKFAFVDFGIAIRVTFEGMPERVAAALAAALPAGIEYAALLAALEIALRDEHLRLLDEMKRAEARSVGGRREVRDNEARESSVEGR